MKFVTFLKIFAISFASLIGAMAIGYGIMVAVGYFDEPEIYPTNISFEFSEYNVDGDFTAKVVSSTQDVTMNEIELALPQSLQIEEKNGVISDGVISIPKFVTLGEEFSIKVDKTLNDNECDGNEWITGGHSVIRATSVNNPECEPAKANVNVDVPVYKVELVTSSSTNLQDLTDENTFVINSEFGAYFNFYPKRSAYQFSYDGENGYDKRYKNTYFMLQSSNDENIVQQGTTNKFTAINVSDVDATSTIEGYIFSSTIIEQSVVKLFEDKTEDAKYAEIMSELKRLANDNTSLTKKALTSQKSVKIVDLDVDKLEVLGNIGFVNVNKLHTLYASKNVSDAETNSTNLNIKLSSSANENVSLQSKLSNVAITFYYKQGNSLFNAVNNENQAYNIINIPSDGFSKTKIIPNSVSATTTYYYPVLTNDYNDYYWQFSVLQGVDAESLVVEIIYIDENLNIEPVRKYFSTQNIVSSPINWNNIEPIELTIYDNEDDDSIVYEEINIQNRINVPTNNLYQTTRFFAFSNEDLTNYIYCKSAVEYTLGTQSYTLYEIENGIIKPKDVSAHAKTFRVIFVTVQTDMFGAVKLDSQNRYIIDQYSQDSGVLSAINVSITKTLKSVNSNIRINGDIEDYQFEENEQQNLAFVHKSTNPFDVVLTYGGEYNETEEAILKQSIEAETLTVVAKTNGVYTDIVEILNITEEKDSNNKTCFRFSLKINELSTSITEMKINLYSRYLQSNSTLPNDVLISSIDDDTQIGYIEVYDGHAVQFNFNINLTEEYKSSANNRINANVVIKTDDNNNLTNISNSYTLNGQDVSNYLFVQNEGGVIDYTSLNIVIKDKHGRLPLSSSYTLQSTNQTLVVTGTSSITFVGSGDVELNLVDSQNNVRDTLYFKAQDAGMVVKVDKLIENVENGNAIKTTETEYEYDETQQTKYEFPQLTISVYGYANSIIYLNSTDNNVNNLINYEYGYNENNEQRNVYLTSKMQFEIKQDSAYEDCLDLMEVNLLTETGKYIRFTKDFGQSKSLTIIASVPELGISQTIILNIKPNISIKTSVIDTETVNGAVSTTGEINVYADSIVTIDVTVQYYVKTETADNSTYAFFAMTNNNQKQLGGSSSEDVYIRETNSTYFGEYYFQKIDNETLVYQFQIKFVFNTVSDIKNFVISFKKSIENEITNADASSLITFKVYPNAKAEVVNVNEILYLKNVNDGVTTGQYLIYGSNTDTEYPISVERIVNGNGQYDDVYLIDYAKINIQTSSEYYDIEKNGNDFILKCRKQLIQLDIVTVIVTYDEYVIGTLNLKVSPNIQIDLEKNVWIKYDNEYYLALSQDIVTDDDLKSYFKNGEIDSFEFTQNSNYLEYGETGLTVKSSPNKILGTDKTLWIKVILTNGNSLKFNILILPCKLPFVIYRENGSLSGSIIEIEDLKNMLDVEFLRDNYLTYYFEYSGADENGMNITFDFNADNQESLDGAIGIRRIEGANYYVRNLDENDANVYARYENGKIIAEPVGKDVYVVLYANLDVSSSESLVIPYLIKIKKELVVKTYYPYLSGESNNQEVTGGDLISSNPSFDMEYLNFDSDNKSVINMEENLVNVPNNSKRFEIGRYNIDGEFETVSQSLISYSVTELYYYYYGWKQANAGNISNYAIVNGGIITIKSNNAERIRLKIEISTRSGVKGWYYVSVGEIPNMSFTELKSGVYDANISDITLQAGSEYDLSRYKLSKISNSVTEDITSELKFYILNNKDNKLSVDYSNKQLCAEPSTENWSTQLMFYTKYGALKTVKVNINSNYTVNSNIEEIYSGSTLNLLDGESFVPSDENGVDSPSILSIRSIEIVNLEENEFETFIFIGNNEIRFGLVDVEVNVVFRIVFELECNEETFNYTGEYTITVLPTIAKTNPLNSEDNQHDFGEISGGGIASYAFTDLYNYVGDGDFATWLSSNNNNINIDFINVSMVALTGYNVDLDKSDLTIDVTVPKVASRLNVVYKAVISNVNLQGEKFTVFEVYFTFAVIPTFKLSINYPSPNETDELTREYFYLYSESANQIDFNQNAMFAEDKRIIVDESEKANVYVGVKSEYVQDAGEVEQRKQLEQAQFTFNSEALVESIGDVTFTIYYKTGDVYTPIEYYNVTISKNAVVSVSSVNFETQNKQNSYTNPEVIYIGANDDILTKINVRFKLTEQSNVDEDLYIKFTSVGGVEVVNDNESLFYINSDMVGVELSTYITLNLNANDTLTGNSIDFEVYTKQGDTFTDVTAQKNIDIFDVTINSRISLKYAGEYIVDFYKAYNVVDKSELSVKNDIEGQTSKNIIINSINIGTYYINHIFDVIFEQQQDIRLSTSQSTSLLYRDAAETNDSNFMSVINMKKISDNSYYTQAEFGRNLLSLKVSNVQGNNKSYIRMTSYEDVDNVVYDYVFLAMGAPNDEVNVTLDVILTYGTVSKTYAFSFIIENDYSNLSLYNHDKTINSSVNRCLIKSNSIVTMAFASSQNPAENYIYITHENAVEGNVIGNIAPYFNILIDQGSEYIEKMQQTDSNMDLVFKFADIYFGNVNIDIVFTDEYGYTFTFFITLVAKYNPVYNGGTLTIYELDSVEILEQNDAPQNGINVTLPIVIEQRDEGNLIDFQSINVNVKFKDENKQLIKDDKDKVIEFDSKTFNMPLIPEKYFANGTMFNGYISIEFSTNNNQTNSSIDIPVYIYQRYYLQPVEQTTYVRDGVAFSLLDVVDVVDSKNNVSVGERYLKDANTAYIKLSIEGGTLENLIEMPVIGIEAVNTINNQAYRKPITVETSEIYCNLNDLFGLENIQNYKFYLIYWPITGGTYEYFKVGTEKYEITETLNNNNPKLVFTTGDDEQEITLTISASQLVNDQYFYIGLRTVANNQLVNVYFVTENNEIKTLKVLANVNEEVVYSLYGNGLISNGQKLTLYTNQDRTCNNGLYNSDLSRLKGVKFGNDEDNFAETLYIEDDAEFKNSELSYKEQNLTIEVSYGLQNGTYLKSQQFTTQVRVTLKYVDINTLQAYGSSTLRFVESYSNNIITLSQWAGDFERPFTLITGYTNATSSWTNEDLILSHNVNNYNLEYDNLEFSINTSQSSSQNGNTVQIDENGDIALPEGFDTANSYIAIDVYVKYGETKTYSKFIKTLLIAPRQITPTRAVLKYDKLLYELNDYDYKVIKYENVIKLLNVTDDFGNSVNIQSNNDVEIYANGSIISSGGTITQTGDTNTCTISVVINGKRWNFENITLTMQEYEANSMVTNASYNTMLSTENDIKNELLNRVIFKNIYNEQEYAANIFTEDSSVYKYSVEDVNVENENNGIIAIYKYTFKYNNTDVLGEVTVNVFPQINDLSLSQSLSNLNTGALDGAYNGQIKMYKIESENQNEGEIQSGEDGVNFEVNWSGLDVYGCKNIDNASYIKIPVDKWEFSDNDIIYINKTGYSSSSMYIGTVTVNENVESVLIIPKNLTNSIITIQNAEGKSYTFAYYKDANSEEFKKISNVFEYISYINNINQNALSVKIESNSFNVDEYVILNEDKSISIIKDISDIQNRSFTVKIYYSVYDDLDETMKDIIYYSKTFNVV